MAFDYDYLIKEVYKLTKIDLSFYKQNQMKRRIDALLARRHVDSYDKYIDLIKRDKEACKEFVEYITINVSEFYRNPEQWDILTNEILPELIKRRGKKLKIWSAACSTGDEPYSLVMALSKYVSLYDISITATDISEDIIEKAKIGIYGEKSVAGVPKEYLEKYFTKNGNFYSISDQIKKCVHFKKHNLLSDEFYKDYDLIVCRNVLIYFTEEAKGKVFRKYFDSLAKGGFLFIGSTEQIIDYRDIGFGRRASFFYEKPQT